MTITWMVYVVMVAALLTAAAYAAERAFRARKRPTRWIWATALAASLAVPVLMSSVTLEFPSLESARSAPTVFALRSMASPALAPARWMSGVTDAAAPSLPRADLFLLTAWAYTSAALIAWLFISCVHLAWRRRKWQSTELLGARVFIAHGLGPAVVGFLKPSIVLPPWILSSSRPTQSLVLAHERQHVAARDPQLLAAAILLLVVMPWNLPVWWQLRRLRHAIEVDCDARVLAQGRDAVEYGECLLDVGTRLSTSAAAVAAMSESRSLLEQRIRIMMTLPQSWRRASMLAPLALSIALVAVAAEVSPPNTSEVATQPGPVGAAKSSPPPQLAKVDPAIYDRYAGHYKMPGNEYAVLKVWRDGTRMMSQMTAQPPIELYPSSTTEFFVDPKLVDARITFVTEGSATSSSLVLHQGGMDIPAPRIDDVTARQLADALALKIQANQPNPGSEAALRQLLHDLAAGTPNYDTMGAALAQATRTQLPRLKTSLQLVGKLESLSFVSAGTAGADVYRAKFENGALDCRIVLDADGKITGALLLPAP